jgi:hypothetical protein
MKPEIVLKPEFVEFIPDELEEQVLYIAATYRTVMHLCCCGCRRKIVTPLAPTAWKLTFDGVSVTLYPSIGNWNLPCRSHYWIDQNRINWAGQWTASQIEVGREAEVRARERFYGEEERSKPHIRPAPPPIPNHEKRLDGSPPISVWRRLWSRLFG